MTWEIAFVFLLLAFAVVSFTLEKLPTDLTAITLFGAVMLAGLLPWAEKLPGPERLIKVFANPAPITIAAMFVVSAALQKCGAIDILAGFLSRVASIGMRKFLPLMILSVAFISAFTNNTPVVVVFMPVVLSLARTMEVPASKLLIPLSYASIFGGTCTLVGTSTNILASEFMEEAGQPPLAMFELAWVGVPLLLVATVYLTLFSNRLLPKRETLTSILSEEERKEFLTEAFVQKGSELVGKTVDESGILKGKSLRVLEIVRSEVVLRVNPKTIPLEEGDRLLLSCRPSGFAHARSLKGLELFAEMDLGLEAIAAHEGSIVEAVIGPRSTLTGKKVKALNFRQRFNMIILAIHRKGINVREKIDQLEFDFGDILLLMGTDRAIEELRKSDDILLLDRPATPAKSRRKKMPLAVGTLAAIILLVSLNLAPIVAASLIGCGFLFLTGCLHTKEAYQSIDWSIIFLIYGMLGIGLAMQDTGAAQLIAGGMISAVENVFSEALKPYAILAGIYLCTAILTELLSNNATIVLMAPITLWVAADMGIDPRPLLIATMIAASASFSTPIGYQTNTYVYGVGGYKFRDFAKIGLPLNFLYFTFSVILIPLIWPL